MELISSRRLTIRSSKSQTGARCIKIDVLFNNNSLSLEPLVHFCPIKSSLVRLSEFDTCYSDYIPTRRNLAKQSSEHLDQIVNNPSATACSCHFLLNLKPNKSVICHTGQRTFIHRLFTQF